MNSTNPFFSRPWMSEQGCAAAVGIQGLKGILAGGITGALEITITYPTEYVKTQLQLDESGKRKRYKGIGDCILKTLRERGFFGLYRGLSILLLGSVPKSSIRFGSYEFFKAILAENDKLSARNRFLCGLGAGTTEAVIIVTPMETIKVKFINDLRSANPRYKGLFQGVAAIIKEEGFNGVYKGVLATTLKQGTNQAIRFLVMDELKDWYTVHDRSKHIPTFVVGIFGGIAGGTSVLCNAPIDVIKTRMQGLDSHRYTGFIDCASKILMNEGPRAFYKGTVARLSRCCLDVAITFMLYDNILRFMS